MLLQGPRRCSAARWFSSAPVLEAMMPGRDFSARIGLVRESPDAHQPRVIIIGGGFAGIAAARELRRAPAEVVLIDRKNHHLFQPLLYQVAGCMLADDDIASPIRERP